MAATHPFSDSKYFSTGPGRLPLDKVYPRRPLFKALAEAEHPGAVWIDGPAGSGKSTALNYYLAEQKRTCAWIAMNREDSDIAVFLYRLSGAVSDFCSQAAHLRFPSVQEAAADKLSSARHFLEKLLGSVHSPLAIVLDDYHAVGKRCALHQVINHAVSQCPEHIRFYTLSRREMPWELTRLCVNNILNPIGRQLLNLDPDETRAFVHTVNGKKKCPTDIDDLHHRTEGWIMGIMLLLENKRLRSIEPHGVPQPAFEKIYDYLQREVFATSPPYLRSAMLQLAFLPEITPLAADRILKRLGSEDLLDHLHRRNLFLHRCIGNRIAYRFHPLMQNFLQHSAGRMLPPTAYQRLLFKSTATLLDKGEWRGAFELHLRADDPSAAAALLVSRASKLVYRGNFGTLAKLIKRLPASEKQVSPRLIYWRSICRLSLRMSQASPPMQNSDPRKVFIETLNKFEQWGDLEGSYLALAGIMDSIWMEMADYRRLDPWIDRYEKLRAAPQPIPSSQEMFLAAPAITIALVLRQPDHPDLPQWFERGMVMLQSVSDAGTAVRVFVPMALYHLLRGNLVEVEHLIDLFKWCAEKSAPITSRFAFYSLYTFYCLRTARWDASWRIDDAVAALEKESGFYLPDLKILGAMSLLYCGDTAQARSRLEEVAPLLAYGKDWSGVFYCVAAGWLALLEKKIHGARAHCLKALARGSRLGNRMFLPILHLLCARMFQLTGKEKIARIHLEKAKMLSNRFSARQTLFSCHLAEAEFALAKKDEETLTSALKTAFELGSKHNYLTAHFWSNGTMAQLCAEALKRDLEIDYARKVIRHHALIPPEPPKGVPHWPWPVKIYTFGDFRLEINGAPLVFKGKAPLKPLLLLKYLLACGGRNVPAKKVQSALWPDSDGEKALNSFKGTLRKLREILGDGDQQTVPWRSKHLSLNEKLCWTDLWEFEDLYRRAKPFSAEDLSGRKASVALKSLLSLNQGPFLSDETAYWAIHRRKELASHRAELVERFTIEPDL